MVDQGREDVSASRARNAARASQPVYTRKMPGGGNVRVELLVSDRGNVAAERLTGRLVMEADARPVVLEEVQGNDPNFVVDELLKIARDNAAIARRVMKQMRAEHRAD